MMSAISFFCVICGHAMRVSSAHAGSLTECARCKRSVPVPGPVEIEDEEAYPLVWPEDILSVDINFLCHACQVQLVTDARWEGRDVDCPKCRRPVQVPAWSRRTLPAVTPGKVRLHEAPAVSLTAEEIRFLSDPLSLSAS